MQISIRSLIVIMAGALLLCRPTATQAQWEAVDIPGFDSQVREVRSSRDGELFVAAWTPGPHSYVAYSPDWGDSWESWQIRDTYLQTIEVLGNNEILIAGHAQTPSAGVLLQGDRLDNLDPQYFDEGSTAAFQYYDLSFVDDLDGMMSGTDGQILTTVDGGQNWAKGAGLQDGMVYRHVVRADASTAYALGGPNFLRMTELWASTDGGRNWRQVHDFGANADITDVFLLASGRIVVCGTIPAEQFGFVRSSDDDGSTWNTNWEAQSSFYFTDMQFRDSLEGYACGYDGLFLRTSDGGETWSRGTAPFAGDMDAICVCPGGAAYDFVFADGGRVFRRQNQVTSAAEQLDSETSLKIQPHPAERGAVLRVPESLIAAGLGAAELHVYAASGVAVWRHSVTSPRIPLGGPGSADLAAGLYTYQLLIGGVLRSSGTFVVR